VFRVTNVCQLDTRSPPGHVVREQIIIIFVRIRVRTNNRYGVLHALAITHTDRIVAHRKTLERCRRKLHGVPIRATPTTAELIYVIVQISGVHNGGGGGADPRNDFLTYHNLILNIIIREISKCPSFYSETMSTSLIQIYIYIYICSHSR